MIYPEFLKDNGKIGFLAPSFGCATEPYKSAYENAKKRFTELGYKLSEGPNVYASDGVGISNTPEKCAGELNDSFESDADVLITCGGGELMCEILPFVDFERIKKAEPKWIMGYSDITNITFLMNTICDTAAIYGPCVSSFGQNNWHQAIMDAYLTLRGEKSEFSGYDKWELESLKSAENPYASYNATEDRSLKAYVGGMPSENVKMSGRLLGGCMDCLQILAGTGFDRVKEFNEKYGDEGILWFLESCELKPFDLRRCLWHLKACGWFEKVSGFIIGRPMMYGEESFGLDMYQAVLEPLKEFGVPIIMDADIGHLPPQIPIISGAYAEVTLSGQSFSLKTELR